METLIKLISLVGRICSSLERPVLYSAEYYSTSQDYKKMEKNSVRVFDKNLRKPHNVTLTVPSNIRDKRKSRASTFVNFIHQKDAQIAMSIAFNAHEYPFPLYTVHDNFITNTKNCEALPVYYLNVIKGKGTPLQIINRFIYTNIIKPVFNTGHSQRYYSMEHFDDKIISLNILDEFLKIGGTPQSEAGNVAGWKKIIEQFKQRYVLYTMEVCGPPDDDDDEVKDTRFDNHLKKWVKFRNQLQGRSCIHH